MINFNYDTKDAFSEYQNAYKRKGKDERALYESIDDPMKDCYENYQAHFNTNDLEYMPSARVGQDHKNELLDLYGSDKKIIKDFRRRFFANNSQSYNNLCPYCTINEASTTEHILPKNTYPEYAVDVLNLIPACGQCNSMKGEDVVNDENKKITLNFYTDILPEQQYLFVDFEIKGDAISATYRVDNPNGQIDEGLFGLIKRHYEKFSLVGKDSRFDQKAMQSVSELVNDYIIEDFKTAEEYDTYTAKRIRKLTNDQNILGYNYWRTILHLEAARSNVFKEYILSKSRVI